MFKTNMKKALSLIMVFCMVFSIAACGKKENNPDSTPTPKPTNAPQNNNDNNNPDSNVPGNQGDNNDTPTAPASYTYNLATSAFPTNWNIHAYETATDADIVDYIVDGFYNFDYNETLDGYQLVPAMAVGDPVDVTSQYVGKYGIAAGDKAKAWKLTLRDDLKWEDGTPINAHSFVTSAELLLNPIAKNHRADMLYTGNLTVVGARDFFYSGRSEWLDMISSDYADVDTLVEQADGTLTTQEGFPIAVQPEAITQWSSRDTLADYYDDYNESNPELFTIDGVNIYDEQIIPNLDADGRAKVTKQVMEMLMQFCAILHGFSSVEEYAEAAGPYAYQEWEEWCFTYNTFPEHSFDEVGVFATADNELVLILEKPLEGFYLLYSLGSSWLVHEGLYNSCASVKDGVYTNSYGTSVETTMSYGPYKLTFFQSDKEYTLSKNENYYGLTPDTYMTTAINVKYVGEASTRLEMLLSGQIDSYGLQPEDMETYQASDHTYYTPGASTFFIALNPDLTALTQNQEALGANYNKTILTIKEFRMALSFALDRAKFALAVSPLNSPAFGVFSSMIVSNPEEGIMYRSEEEAKQVLVDFWNLANDIGPGKMYADKDEAIESITGYNLAMAKQYFDRAYDIAVANGLMKETDTVSILIGLPNNTSNFYAQGYEFLVNCYTDAVVGTKLEGKLEFTMDATLGNGFGTALRTNQVDMLFGVGWTGSTLNPYGLMEAYTTEDYQYNPHWDTSQEMLTINLNGTDYTASVLDWTKTMSGDEITITAANGTKSQFKAGTSDNVDKERFTILAALEGAVLETYDLIPMIDEAGANLKGMQIQYYTEDYVFGMGRGGVKYMTYNYTDAEWDQYVASQGGQLNYK